MAGDTRDPSSPATANPPTGTSDIAETMKKYEAMSKTPPPSVNAMPKGYGENTAGSRLGTDYTIIDAAKTVRLGDFKQLHMYPCVRESFLTGIGAGFGIGGLRAIFGAPIPKAANWAVGSFMLLSIASYEYCTYKRQNERAGMRRAVELMDEKKIKMQQRAEAMEAKRAERRKAKEEADRKEAAAKRWNSWKFW